MPSCTDWRGEWLSLHDLASLMGKSYETVKKLHQAGALAGSGLRIHRISRRVWVQIDRSLYDNLRDSCS